MKSAFSWAGWILGALLVLFAFDCWFLHPVGRWQLHAMPGLVYRIDTTTGNVDRFNWDAGRWEHLEGKK